MSHPLDNSIAVLPFSLLKLDNETLYLGDGIAAELISGLTRFADLKVVAKTSSFALRNERLTTGEIAKRLNVSRIIEGTILISELEVKVTIQLINAETGFVLWSSSFQKKREDLYELVKELTEEVLSQMAPTIKASIRSGGIEKHKTTPEAYDLYLQGVFYWSRWTLESIRKAMSLFEASISKDSSFTLAYVSLSNCWSWLGGLLYEPTDTAHEKSKEAILKALKLDSNLVEAHVALSLILFLNEADLKGALLAIYKAINLNPNSSEARLGYGMCLLAAGKTKQALQELQLALHLDPLSPMVNSTLGYALQVEKRYEEARLQFKKTLIIDPLSDSVITSLCWNCLLERDIKTAERYYAKNKAKVLHGSAFEVFLKMNKGEKEEAIALTEWLRNTISSTAMYRELSLCYIALGDMKTADNYINQFYEAKSGFMMVLSHPAWKGFRESSYYRKYKKRMGLFRLPVQGTFNNESTLVIKSNTKDEVTLRNNQLLYIKADTVYSTIVWEDGGVIQSKDLRITLSELEDQFINPEIIRCHRSFMVNIDFPFELKGVSRKYSFVYGEYEVPVSRKYEEVVLSEWSTK